MDCRREGRKIFAKWKAIKQVQMVDIAISCVLLYSKIKWSCLFNCSWEWQVPSRLLGTSWFGTHYEIVDQHMDTLVFHACSNEDCAMYLGSQGGKNPPTYKERKGVFMKKHSCKESSSSLKWNICCVRLLSCSGLTLICSLSWEICCCLWISFKIIPLIWYLFSYRNIQQVL